MVARTGARPPTAAMKATAVAMERCSVVAEGE